MKTKAPLLLNSRMRKYMWFGFLCLFFALSVAYQLFPGDDVLISKAQGTLPNLRFKLFLPFN